MRFRLAIDGDEHEVAIVETSDGYRVVVDDTEFEVEVAPEGAGIVAVTDGVRAHIERSGRSVSIDGEVLEAVTRGLARGAGVGVGAAGGELHPPMPGRIKEVLVSEGDEVEAGQALVVLEAMKMQNELSSPGPARIVKVYVEAGQAVETSDVLLALEPI